jgi:signal transduction histidine kinase
MDPRTSLRARILLTYAGLISAGFLLLAIFAGRQLSAGTIADFEQRLAEQASLVAIGLHDPIESALEGEGSEASLATALAGYADQFNSEVTLLHQDGRLWLGSQGQDASGLQEAPEVVAAAAGRLATDRRRDSAGGDRVLAAAPLTEDGSIVGIVHLSAPLAEAQSLVVERWLALLAGVFLLLLLVIGASLWLSSSLTRPLIQLRRAANEIARGEFAPEWPEPRQDEIGQLADAFGYMSGQVEAMLAEQQAFAANASHELRTPLTTIRLRTEALRYEQVDEATARRYLVEIDEEARRLGYLVDDLIVLSRLDSGRMQPGHQRVDPLRLARQLMAEYRPESEAKNVTLTLDAPAALPSIEASLTHLRLVCRNLLGNAIKYCHAGAEVFWRLRLEGSSLHFTFADTGQGIAAEDLPHLFERFYRADPARSRAVAGAGLGLSLVKMTVEFYGGRVVAASPGLGQGSTFDVWWPLQPPAGLSPTPPPRPAPADE